MLICNRSALEWIVDQVSTDVCSRQALRHRQRPNRDGDSEYIVRLIGQVIHVSVETAKRTPELTTLALLQVEATPQIWNSHSGTPADKVNSRSPHPQTSQFAQGMLRKNAP
jgi:hypothetical protein